MNLSGNCRRSSSAGCTVASEGGSSPSIHESHHQGARAEEGAGGGNIYVSGQFKVITASGISSTWLLGFLQRTNLVLLPGLAWNGINRDLTLKSIVVLLQAGM